LCQQERSLILTNREEGTHGSFNAKNLWLGTKEFTRFQLKHDFIRSRVKSYTYQITSEFCALLQKLFPKLEKLIIDILLKQICKKYIKADSLFTLLEPWQSQLTLLSLDIKCPSSQFNNLADRINGMTGLKQLALSSDVEGIGARQLAPSL